MEPTFHKVYQQNFDSIDPQSTYPTVGFQFDRLADQQSCLCEHMSPDLWFSL